MEKEKNSFWIIQSIRNKTKIEVFTNKADAIQYICELTGDTNLIVHDFGKSVLIGDDVGDLLYSIEKIKIRK